VSYQEDPGVLVKYCLRIKINHLLKSKKTKKGFNSKRTDTTRTTRLHCGAVSPYARRTFSSFFLYYFFLVFSVCALIEGAEGAAQFFF